MPILDRVLSTMRLRSSEVCACPACGRRVTERDARVRLRGETYAHRGCATYRARQAGRVRSSRTGGPADG